MTLYDNTKQMKLYMSYRGPFLENFTESFIGLSENSASNGRQGPQIGRKIQYLLVECFQNIVKHSDNKGLNNDEGIFTFKNFVDFFVINSINRIKNSEVAKLCSLINDLNSLSEAELKQRYQQQLSATQLNSKGGAGLGLLEMSRKSGQKLNYEVERINDEYSLFHQQISIMTSGLEAKIPLFIEQTRTIYHNMISDGVMLQFKGEFSQKTLLPILRMVDASIAGSSSRERNKRVGHVLVEMLQNISKHADVQSENPVGIFSIGRKNGSVFIESGNAIEQSKRAVIEQKLEYLNSLKLEDLKELHKHAIYSSLKFENKNKSGLGLIEIAMLSITKLKFAFKELGDNKFFFSLRISV